MSDYTQKRIETLKLVSCVEFERHLKNKGITFRRGVSAGSVYYMPRDVARDWDAWKAGIQWAEDNRI